MTHDKRAADTIRSSGVANPGRLLLALDRAGLVINDTGDATRLTIVTAERDDYAHALAQAAEGDWTLARHLLRTRPYKRILSAYDESREAEWVRQAKAAKGAA